MLHLQAFTFNPFQENTFLLYNDEGHAWIVDPGMQQASEEAQVDRFLEEKKLVLQGIINTHAHIDHIFGIQHVVQKHHVSFRLHKKELPILNNAPAIAAMFGLPFSGAPQPDSFISEKEPLLLGNDELRVLFTPGHSPGSISFYSEEGRWLIGGDVLFAGSIGRTDLPGGDYETLIHSIRTQLLVLPDDTTVFPGHGPATTIGAERAGNPFLQ